MTSCICRASASVRPLHLSGLCICLVDVSAWPLHLLYICLASASSRPMHLPDLWICLASASALPLPLHVALLLWVASSFITQMPLLLGAYSRTAKDQSSSPAVSHHKTVKCSGGKVFLRTPKISCNFTLIEHYKNQKKMKYSWLLIYVVPLHIPGRYCLHKYNPQLS